ncbi:major facilitator superfamily domain-containing protein [Macrophomina phaseolina]|uniref:Lysosomal dipeptide transporter MFSD1 n=1 Tax=Macrophomina phaseolina TaxID=35725 RepID=A0ABQ8GGV8_9PEZI|nr:major facilitator superfamily domain-containing protein [Macrophomina phaseolina]
MQDKPPVIEIVQYGSNDESPQRSSQRLPAQPPLRLKVISTLLVCLMGFGTYYNQGLLGAVKTPLKKTLHINNMQFSLILCTQDLSVALMMPFSGLLTDYIGGAGLLVISSSVGVVGSVIVASAVQIRSWESMMLGSGLLALGNMANSTARYRLFSAWFPPNHGFALTLSFELAAAKMGMLVSKACANPIAEAAGDLAWSFWVAVFADLAVFLLAIGSLFFVRACRKKHAAVADPATGERLLERTGRFEPRRLVELPWTFWCVVGYHVFQTTTLLTFAMNLTELVEDRFSVPPRTAGWVSGVVIGGNFMLIPAFGALIDRLGQRLSLMAAIGLSMTVGMALLRFDAGKPATAVALAFVSLAICPTILVAYDATRSSLWHQELYGTANAVKVSTGFATSLVVRVGIGILQDRNGGSYRNVLSVYLALAVGAVLSAAAMILGSVVTLDLGRFQWSKEKRAALGHLIAARTKVEDERLVAGKNRLNVRLSIHTPYSIKASMDYGL